MGKDNLFHKRKESLLKRKKPTRNPYDTVLILCGGETEYKYFSAIKKELRLASVKIKNSDSNPLSIVKEAEKNQRDGFDRIYCIFDKDQYSNFDDACIKIKSKKSKKIIWEAITSNPCFEFWILLHYEFTTAPFNDCKQVINKIQKHICYRKNDSQLWDKLRDKVDEAIKNSEQVRSNKNNNPFTNIDLLVSYLRNMKFI